MKILICFTSLMNSTVVSINVVIGLITSPFLFHQGFTQTVGRQKGHLIFHVKKVRCPKQTVNVEWCVLVSFIIWCCVGFAQAVNGSAVPSPPALSTSGCSAVAADRLSWDFVCFSHPHPSSTTSLEQGSGWLEILPSVSRNTAAQCLSSYYTKYLETFPSLGSLNAL